MPEENIHPSWKKLIENNEDFLEKLFRKISAEEYNPPKNRVLRFASTDLGKIRAVILGQDPYPQPGAATGRSFEVAGLESWTEPFAQSSLRNIVRAIYAAKTGEVLKWTEVRKKIADGEFSILPPDKLWDALEAQGVLFVNAYLTCRAHEPLSHKALWEPFSREMVKFIDENAAPCWFLWGAGARSYEPLIKKGKIYASRHPMMTTSAEDDFLKNPCFRETADFIDWTGR